MYVYWPWGRAAAEAPGQNAISVIMTASRLPGCARWLPPNPTGMMKSRRPAARGQGQSKLYFGMVCGEEKQRLTPSQVKMFRPPDGCLLAPPHPVSHIGLPSRKIPPACPADRSTNPAGLPGGSFGFRLPQRQSPTQNPAGLSGGSFDKSFRRLARRIVRFPTTPAG